LFDRRVERRLIGLRGRVEAGQLAHELQGRGADFVVGRRRVEIEQGLDVAAHGGGPPCGWGNCDYAPEDEAIPPSRKNRGGRRDAPRPCLRPPDPPYPRAEIGGGRAPRQPGQGRKAAATTNHAPGRRSVATRLRLAATARQAHLLKS